MLCDNTFMNYQNKSFEEMAANKFWSNSACCKEVRSEAIKFFKIDPAPGSVLATCGSIFICHSDWGKGFKQELVGRAGILEVPQRTGNTKTHIMPHASCQTFMWANVYNHTDSCLALISKYQKLWEGKVSRKVSTIEIESFLTSLKSGVFP